MKIIVNGLDLNSAVASVSKALPQKEFSPILEGIKIVARDDKIVLFASDTDLSIEKTISARVEEEGEILVPGKILADYIRNIADSNDIILSCQDDNKLTITYARSECYIQCLPFEEYPEKENVDKSSYFVTTQRNLKDIVSKVIFSVATEDTRPILKGIFIEAKEYTLSAVATDGYRFAKCNKPLEERNDGLSAIIPARSLNELSKMLTEDEDLVKVYIEKNYMTVDLPGTTLSARLFTEGQYISYENLIPKEFVTTIVANKETVEKSLQTASIMSRGDKNNLVSFDIEEYTMIITSSSEVGKIKESVSISLKGKDMKCSYNQKYILDCLKGMDCDAIKMEFTQHANCVITMNGSDEALYFILPVRTYA